jgi:hypothetical protein
MDEPGLPRTVGIDPEEAAMFRELDRRTNGDDVIALFWDEDCRYGELVIDRRGETQTRRLAAERIADALRHPYLYIDLPTEACTAA